LRRIHICKAGSRWGKLRSNGKNLIEQHDGCPQVLKQINVKPVYITAFFSVQLVLVKAKGA
jgi:hypothetical protein